MCRSINGSHAYAEFNGRNFKFNQSSDITTSTRTHCRTTSYSTQCKLHVFFLCFFFSDGNKFESLVRNDVIVEYAKWHLFSLIRSDTYWSQNQLSEKWREREQIDLVIFCTIRGHFLINNSASYSPWKSTRMPSACIFHSKHYIVDYRTWLQIA